MTEPTRTRLELALCHEEYGNDTCGNVCIHAGKDSVCAFRSAVNVVLDELMNPGEAVFAVTREAWLEEKSPEYVFRVTIGAIREGR